MTHIPRHTQTHTSTPPERPTNTDKLSQHTHTLTTRQTHTHTPISFRLQQTWLNVKSETVQRARSAPNNRDCFLRFLELRVLQSRRPSAEANDSTTCTASASMEEQKHHNDDHLHTSQIESNSNLFELRSRSQQMWTQNKSTETGKLLDDGNDGCLFGGGTRDFAGNALIRKSPPFNGKHLLILLPRRVPEWQRVAR